jgi:hypothetical protein
MPSFSTLIGAFLSAASLAVSTAVPIAQPFENVKAKRQSTNVTTSASNLEVDLGYEIYEGYGNQTTGINIWRGYVNSESHTDQVLITSTVSASLRHQLDRCAGKHRRFLQRIDPRLSRLIHLLLNVLKVFPVTE